MKASPAKNKQKKAGPFREKADTFIFVFNFYYTFFNNMFTVDDDQNQSIKNDITLHELWQTLRPLKATKPGPDGISN